MERFIAEFTVGTVNQGGTDWPVINQVSRDGSASKPWRVTFGICRGIAQSVTDYRTKSEAIAAAEEA